MRMVLPVRFIFCLQEHDNGSGLNGGGREDRDSVKTLHQMFGPKGNPTAANLFNIIACLQEMKGFGCR